MDNRRFLTHRECTTAANKMRRCILERSPAATVYGVPRGGVPVAYMLTGGNIAIRVAETPHEADVIVDDVIDSGRTMNRYRREHGKDFFALTDFLETPKKRGEWVVFPWEMGASAEEAVDQSGDDIVIRLLQRIGEDPKREGLRDTPQRVLRAWAEWTAGYTQDVGKVLKVFADGREGYDEMVVEKDLPFYSHCEHHLAPFFGTATIAYIPDKSIVGLSKLGRVLDIFARRLQVQERLTVQVVEALMRHLKPRGVAVLIKARHLCMESRGYNKQGHVTVTSALRGVFTQHKARNEFLTLAK